MTLLERPAFGLDDLRRVLGPVSQEQAEVVAAPLEAGVVVAGAGSGKTATMVARVVWLVARGLVAPDGVLGLTFTTKAAEELSGRVRRALRLLRREGLLADELADLEPVVSTYHAYAGRLVRDHALRLGREPTARLVTPATSWQLAARAVATYEGPLDAKDMAEQTVVRSVLALAGDLSEHLVDAEQVRALGRRLSAQAGLPDVQKPGRDVLVCQRVREQLLPVVARYAQAKRERELLDFGDVVALAAELARSCPEVGAAEREAHPVVLLDEYQDTGAAQEVLLASLYGGGHPVTAVGDPCQSIYGWRGASAGTLRRFPERFSAPERPRSLRTTYRSGGRVLQLANAVSDELRREGLPVEELAAAPGRDRDGEVRCALLGDVDAEARWVAGQVRDAVTALPQDPDGRHWARAAVLCRKRSMFPRLRAAFEALDVPVEVVGLGGLLTVPEVADLVATLTVVDDPTADAALLRLLTGSRWRLGPRDLAALGRRARALARTERGQPAGPLEAVVLGVADDQAGSLVDALDELPEHGLSDPGRRRLTTLAAELRGLRSRADQPLPELVADVERTLGLDVEVAARPGAPGPAEARADLDAFADAAAAFSGDAAQDGTGEAVLTAFLAFLSAAEEEEHGLDTGVAGGADTVKLMTVHAAKGLEWPVVAVPGLARSTSAQGSAVFPGRAKSTSWTSTPQLLPFPLRGDAADLPRLTGLTARELAAYKEQLAARDAREERRLAYVAFTRAEHLLLCSGHHWGDGKVPLGPSVFLEEARVACEQGAGTVCRWEELPAANPVAAADRSAAWPSPVPPAGERVQRVAERVRALAAASEEAPGEAPERGRAVDPPLPEDVARVVTGWDDDLARLAEEARRRGARRDTAVVPAHLSVTGLVELHRDPAGLARSLLRPLPRRPSPAARRGTAFHAWLEHTVFGTPQLLDPLELPGSADAAVADADLGALQEAFQRSPWWGRRPTEVEVPFEMEVEGLLVRGRMDAVYVEPDHAAADHAAADHAAADHGQLDLLSGSAPAQVRVDVVDWKTGPVPEGPAAEAATVQLAVYRLAWHELTGVPLERIGAAFHHVAAGVDVRPADLLDRQGLRALVRQVPVLGGAEGAGEGGAAAGLST